MEVEEQNEDEDEEEKSKKYVPPKIMAVHYEGGIFFPYFKLEKLFTSNLIPFLKLIMICYLKKKIQTKKTRRRNRLKRPENGRCNPH